jgi:hypothetical protein
MIPLLNISPHSSWPPSMARFLPCQLQSLDGWCNTDRKAPEASTTTSSTLSDSRSINSPTTFLLWNSLLVAGSFWIRLHTAAQAHVRSAYSGDLSWTVSPISSERPVARSDAAYLVEDGQHLILLLLVCLRRATACTEMRIRHTHGVVAIPACLLLGLRFAHRVRLL